MDQSSRSSDTQRLKFGIILSEPFWEVASSSVRVRHTDGAGGGLIVYGLVAEGIEVLLGKRSTSPTYPHDLRPDELISSMRLAGCTHLLTTAVCGGLRTDITPTALVVLDQFIDMRVVGRLREADRFAGLGRDLFVDFSQPYCAQLREVLYKALKAREPATYPSGCYVGVDGPRFETAAEVRLFELAGGDVVGMSAVAEAIVGKLLGMCVATVGIVSNRGAGLSPTEVSNREIAQVAERCAESVVGALIETSKYLSAQPPVAPCGCH